MFCIFSAENRARTPSTFLAKMQPNLTILEKKVQIKDETERYEVCICCSSAVEVDPRAIVKNMIVSVCDNCTGNATSEMAETNNEFVAVSEHAAVNDLIEYEDVDHKEKYIECVEPPIPKRKYHQQLVCEECGSKLSSKAKLEVHQRIHSGVRPFKCPECEASFRQDTHLNDHMRIHRAERPFQCSICDAKFRQKQHLRAHLTAVHTGDTPFECQYCSKRFARRQNYNLHLKVHGEPLFECSKCPRKYKIRQGLKTHIQTVHEGMEVQRGVKTRQHTCGKCGKQFCYLTTYNRHVEKCGKTKANKIDKIFKDLRKK